MSIVDWGSIGKSIKSGSSKGSGDGNFGGGNINYLKLEAGKTYRIRPVSKPKEFIRYYVQGAGQGGKATSARVDRETYDSNCIIRQKYPNLEGKLRYALNVIDRADGKLKVLEGPPSVFQPMQKWAEATKKNPGGREGMDFSVDVKLPANGDKKKTEYFTTPIVNTNFTENEETMIKQGLYKLDELFAPTPQSEIEGRLFPNLVSSPSSLPESSKTDSKMNTAAVTAGVSGSPLDGDEFSF